MSGPISPDGTQIWNGVSWVPLNQNQIYQQGLNPNLQNMPRVVTIQNKSNNAGVFLIVGFFCLSVVFAGVFYVIDSSDERDKKTVIVSEFVVTEENIWNGETTILCNESNTLISPNSHFACEINLAGMPQIDISFSLNSDNHTVNLLTMTKEEYQKFTDGLDSEYIGKLSALDVTNTDLSNGLDTGEYVIIIHNY